ncbi:uncharacterized protein LY89DRAFT_87056 [Mollisia scopiformis]|uniref:Peptidase A1 domain-containing protein n=1 Tax=Mollisia scopiformis TaxID=149040 RepID=A0A194X8R6_MOLSC|nr:uncharacterized protein LY89DRAFT_87056 [Mollisia scopiformis]KUJ16560.1 hypothetical protein LY89DRAFT_87056 [Mollisia scopiformis]
MKTFLQALSIGCLLAASATAGSNASALIPFLPVDDGGITFTDYQNVNFRFAAKAASTNYIPFVDTGSTGMVISAADIPEWTAEEAERYPQGWEYLSSSKKLYNGNWIPKDVYFNFGDPNHELIHAQVPVLCVTSVTVCNGAKYNATINKGSCPKNPDGTLPPITYSPKRIRIMGVGFDRQGDGMPQGTPDKNPFINIVSIGGTLSKDFRAGYIITKKGITIGLTEANMDGMQYVQLPKIHSTVPRSPYDWGAIPACMSVDSAPCSMGTALLDTGLNNSYITLPSNASVSTSPNTTLLVEGSRVKVDFGVATDDFIVGVNVKRGVTPTKVSVTLSDARVPFINTGRHVYRALEVAFDAVGGRVGFRRVS